MPIKGLSDSVRLSRLGKIRLGIRNEKGYPAKVDYFVFAPEVLPLVKSVYGTERPKALEVLIPVEQDEIFASQYYRSYSQSWGLVCKGDGEVAGRTIDHKTGQIAGGKADITPEQITVECKGPDCDIYKAKNCHEKMLLQVMIPKLPGVGIWQIDTGSRNSIINVNSDLAMIRHIVGHVAMVPLTLTLEPAEGKDPATGKKRSFFTLHLRVSGSLGQLLADAKRPLASLEMPKPAVVPDEDGMPDVDADEEPGQSTDQQWDAMKSAAKTVTPLSAVAELVRRTNVEPAPIKAQSSSPAPQEVKATPAAPGAAQGTESRPPRPAALIQWDQMDFLRAYQWPEKYGDLEGFLKAFHFESLETMTKAQATGVIRMLKGEKA